MKVLVVTQLKEFAQDLKKELEMLEIECTLSFTSFDALEILKKFSFNFAIVDINMPQIDGISLMKEMKSLYNLPAAILSNRTEAFDVIYAYEAGCIDYIRYPAITKEIALKLFNYEHFSISRIKSYGPIELDLDGRVLYVDGVKKSLTQKEFMLLVYLTKNQGNAISREQILADVWGYDSYGDDRTIDTHIKMLRNHLGRYKNFIQTYRGYGYKFEVK